jgi:hypothetical protein
MRHDCPHCEKSLEGKFIRWSKIQRKDNMRSCPHCGGEIEPAPHPVEVVTRLLAILVAIGVGHAISRGGGVLIALVVGLAVMAAAYVFQQFWLRDVQRYRRPVR